MFNSSYLQLFWSESDIGKQLIGKEAKLQNIFGSFKNFRKLIELKLG